MMVAAWIVGYLFVFAITWGILVEDTEDEEDMGKSFVLAIVWPIILPLILICAVAFGANAIAQKYLK